MILRKIRTVSGLLGLLWLFGMIAGYYVIHKPFTPAVAVNLASALWQFSVAVSIAAAGGGLGARMLPWIESPPVMRASLQAAFGLGILSISALLAGATIGFHPLLLGVLLLALLVILRKDVRGWIASWREMSQYWSEGQPRGRAIALGSGLILLFALMVALSPPIKFDALVYHLALPDSYLNVGRIIYLGENMFWGMPQNAEMLFLWAMAMSGARGAAVLGWVFGALSLAGILSFAGQHFGARNGWIAVASLVAGSTLSASLAWGYVDWLVMFFGWAFFVCLQLWAESENRNYLMLAGAFAGLATGTKYTAGIIIIAGLGVLWLYCGSWHQRLRSILIFGLAAGVLVAPWMIKNAIATGNPLYPFLFPAGAMDNLRIAWYQDQATWGNWLDVILLPLRASLTGLEGAPGFGASIGPLLFGLGALAWIDKREHDRRRQGMLKIATAIAIGGLVLWAIASRLSMLLIQSRLYFSVFPAIAVLCAAGFEALERQNFQNIRMGRIAGVLVLLVLGLNVFEIGNMALSYGAPRSLMGQVSDEEYLGANLGWYYPAMQAIQDLPDEARVLMLWEPRSYYCLPKCVPDEVIDGWIHDLRTNQEPDLVLASWQEEGYSHVLYYASGVDYVRRDDRRYTLADWEALDRVLSRMTLAEDFGGAYQLFSLPE